MDLNCYTILTEFIQSPTLALIFTPIQGAMTEIKWVTDRILPNSKIYYYVQFA